ncbi:MAG: hypothetical protein ACRDSN_14515 [Pseudonocardiaceae bacterium]
MNRPHETHFLLARQPVPGGSGARFSAARTLTLDEVGGRIRRESIPGGAEHLKRFPQGFEGGRRAQMTSFLLGGAMEGVGVLDERRCGVVQGV